MGFVLQGWLEGLSWKKQTVLLGAIRSPDNVHTLKVKQVVVWIRAIVLNDADCRYTLPIILSWLCR